MKKIFVILCILIMILIGCTPKDDIKDGTHNDDGVIYSEVVNQFVM